MKSFTDKSLSLRGPDLTTLGRIFLGMALLLSAIATQAAAPRPAKALTDKAEVAAATNTIFYIYNLRIAWYRIQDNGGGCGFDENPDPRYDVTAFIESLDPEVPATSYTQLIAGDDKNCEWQRMDRDGRYMLPDNFRVVSAASPLLINFGAFAWEEDGCGNDNTYDDNCVINSDDNPATLLSNMLVLNPSNMNLGYNSLDLLWLGEGVNYNLSLEWELLSAPKIVRVYSDANLSGRVQDFGQADYNVNSLFTGVGNDNISAMQIAPGYKVIAYPEANFQGDPVEFTGTVNFVGSGINDQISSLRIVEDIQPCVFVPSDIVVSGSGFAQINGVYTPSGSQNGAPKWANGNFIIVWHFNQWEIQFGPDAELIHTNHSSAGSTTNLPCDGWDGGVTLSGGCGSLLPNFTPGISITAAPGSAITPGTSVTFTATTVNGGSMPAYQWKKNGNNVGSNSNTYTDNTLVSGDVITCVLTSSDNCASPNTATSNAVTISNACPVFGGAPANVSIVNSSCGSGCTLGGGSITAPSGTPCPAGSTLQYNVNNSGWTTSLPIYDQDGPAQSIKTRCVCDLDANITSAESAAVATIPGTLSNPVVPANGSLTVACPSAATTPTPPTVMGCDGSTITPTGPVIVNSPDPVACEGTRTYTYTYTCGSTSSTWSFVYTIERQPFTVPANGASTVACLANATAPALPTVTSNCGETLTPAAPVITDSPSPLTCEGTRTYAYTYTDCEGNTATWSYVYTIERQPFTVPANGASTVACLANATAPALPTVTSNCGETLTPAAPVITDSPSPLTCEGTRTYAYTYTDCEGNTATWSYVYTIERQPFTVPANGAATVNSPALAVAPVPPTVTSNCGEVLTPAAPVITNSPNPLTCEGTRTYAYTYTDCEGNTATWSFVYAVIDNTPPTIYCSNAVVTFSGQTSLALNVANLASASDNCGAPTVTLSTATVACGQVGQTLMVTATATDATGLTANCISQVTIAGLPCGWSEKPDGIGCADGNTVSHNNGIFTVSSANCYYAAPFTADEAAFARHSLCGNGSITAQVAGLDGIGWAGISLRESDAPGARKVQLMTNLATLSRREVRYTPGGSAYPQQFPSQNKYWLRILRQGNQFVGYVSANGASWSQVFAVIVNDLPNCIQAGLVVTNGQANSTVSATFANVIVTSNAYLPAANTEDSGLEVANLNLFPNPTSGEITVDFTPWAGKPALLEVYDLQGRRVRRLELDEAAGPMPVDMSNLPDGVYLFRVGEAQQRVVLQR